jgi:hypothetical protein
VKYYIYRNGELFSKTPDYPIGRRFADTTAVQSRFPLANFETGDYRLLAVVTDEAAGSEARGECSFRIVPSASISLDK